MALNEERETELAANIEVKTAAIAAVSRQVE